MSGPRTSLRSIAALFGSLIFILIGLLAFYFCLPHPDPWRMTHVEVKFWTKTFVEVTPPFSASFYRVPMTSFLLLPMLVLTAACLLTSSGRRALLLFLEKKTVVNASLLWFLFLLITLLPCLWVGGIFSRSVSVNLILGFLGFLFAMIGSISLLQQLRWSKTFLSVITMFYEPVRRAIFTSKIGYFLSTVFLVELAFTNLVSSFTFEHIPHIQDSIAQVFHGMIFAQGSLTAPSPLLKEFFDFTHMINNGQWYSQYPPGHSVLLMLGVFFGAPWIINPLLGSATLILFYQLGKELYGEVIGRLSALLGLLSPFVLFMSSEFMNHSSSLFFFMLFALYFVKMFRSSSIRHALIAGCSLGWLMTIRQLTAVGVALPLLLYGCWVYRSTWRQALNPIITFIGSTSFFILMLLLFNYLTNGHPLTFGYQMLYGDETLPGFGNAAWGGPHTIVKGIHHTLDNLLGMNKYLFEWPIPSLVFLIILFASWTLNKWDYLLVGGFVSLAFVYVFYWYQDWCFGPRYLYEAAGLTILLTARGIERVPYWIRFVFRGRASIRSVSAVTAFVVALLFGVGFVSNIPAHLDLYGRGYWGVTGKARKTVEQHRLSNAIVFTKTYYGSVLTANLPDLTNNVLFVRDLGSENNKKLMRLYRGYCFYIVTEDSLKEYREQ